MKYGYIFIISLFLAISPFFRGNSQTISEIKTSLKEYLNVYQNEIIVYSNSFETVQDTAGWGRLDFRSDAPPGGGNQSVFISGGCLVPHASIEIGPFPESGSYIVRCWGKNLSTGGGVSINIREDFINRVSVHIDDEEWNFYESAETLYCPAGEKIILSMSSGGFIPGGMLVDNVEVVNVQPDDNGHWVQQFTGYSENFKDVVMLDSSTAIVAGDYSTIIKTTDSGKTWRNTAPQVDCMPGTDFTFRLNKISFCDKLNGIIVGEDALITTDGGEEWHFINIPTENELLSVLYRDTISIYAGDNSGFVYHSSDSGNTWTSDSLTNLPIRAIYPSRADSEMLALFVLQIYALTPHSIFIKTEYPPTSWSEWGNLDYFHGFNSGAFDGEFSEDGTHFIAGVEGEFIPLSRIIRLRLPDSHWYSVSPENETGELYGVSITGSDTIYVCGSNGKVLKSTNNGDYWISQTTSTNKNLNSVFFFDNKKGFAVGDSGTVLYTSNGGISSYNTPPYPFHLQNPVNEYTSSIPRSMDFSWQASNDPDNDPISYTLLMSADTGATWKTYGPVINTTSLHIQSPAMTPGRYFWTVIANDGMFAAPSLDVFAFNIYSLAEAEKLSNNPEEFALHQNYPNPFNPVTTIKYSIPNVETGHAQSLKHVLLKVYDFIGREVAVLIDEEKPAGEYQVEFSAKDLSSGIYIYELNIDGNRLSGKMCLIK